MTVTFSVVIPTFNEAANIARCIAAIRSQGDSVEIIVVDGGSTDNTVAIAEGLGVTVRLARRGRGIQCNAGARHAGGEVILFLHADTLLPGHAFSLLRARFRDSRVRMGKFRLRFDQDHWLYHFYGAFSRFDSIFTSFGDQCIIVRRSFFWELGGFPDWPLFEDVAFFRAARARGTVHSFQGYVTTSARRFAQEGLLRQSLQNALLVLRYLFGASPKELAEVYEESRESRG